jgi:protocatechuate 3,4-dioxygenase beta subunit
MTQTSVFGVALLLLSFPATPARAALEIQVTDRDGRPASGVTVCAQAAPPSLAESSTWVPAERCGTTGDRGRLVLSRGEDERLILCAADPRFAARRVEVGDASSITLSLQPARTVSVEVRGPDGKLAAGVRARHLCEAGSTDPTGRLALGVPESGADVEFVAANGLRARTVFLPGESEPRTVTLHPPRQLSGRILDVARPQHQPDDEHASVLAGRVVGPDRRPVSGAWVEAARGGAETDDQGRFRIAGLVPGAAVSLSVQAPGLRGGLSSVRLPLEGSPALVAIQLEPAAALAGRLTDAGGRPIAGAVVTLQEPPSPRVLTDGDGRFLLDGLAPGRREAVALRPGGRRLARAAVELKVGPNPLDLTVPAGLPVSGRVVDEQGAPVPAARLFLEGEDPEDRWLAVGAEDGSFLLTGIPEGDYRLSVLAAGFAQPEPRPVRIAGAPLHGLTLRVGRGGSITGSLIGLAPRDLNGLVIRARAARSQRLGLADPDGRYLISDVPPGHWEVTVQTGTGRQALGSVDVVPGVEAALDLRLTSGITLTGRLLVDGRPAAGTLLATAADLSEARDRGGWSPTGAGGAFTVAGLTPGSYLLLAVVDNALWPVKTVELTADREISLDLATGTVTGRILGPYGAPLAGAHVSLRAKALGIDAFLPGPRVESDSQGLFVLPRVPAGNHRLLITHGGATPFETAVRVPAGGTIRVEIPLAPGS